MAKHGNLQKYENPNPVQRWLLDRFLRQVGNLISPLNVTSVLDAGCAEGFVSRYLREHVGRQTQFWGVDVDSAALARGQKLTPWMLRCQASVLTLPYANQQFDLVLCNEVLEHLDEPSMALRELLRVSRGHVLLSVPHEPWFQTLNLLRGKNLRYWGNDPEHVQHWNMSSFVQALRDKMDICAAVNAFPWLVVLGKIR